MARKKQRAAGGFVLFDVVYSSGARTSNRKVPSAALEGLDGGEEQVRRFIEAQDREIAAMSGRPRGPVKSLTRSPTR